MNPPTPHGIATKPVRRRRPSLAVVALLGVAAGAGLQLATRGGGTSPEGPASAAGRAAAHAGEGAAPGAPAPGALAAGGGTDVGTALAGLDPPPSIGQVLGSQGLEQMALIGRFVATADPGALRRLVDTLLESKALTTVLADAIFLRWTAIDPAGALGWTEGKRWIKPVMGSMAKSDPEAALAYGLEHGGAASVIRSVAQGDPAGGQALLAAHPEFEGRIVWEGIASGLARSDSRAAAIYALEHGIDGKDYLRRWAAEDPTGAFHFAYDRRDPKQRSEALAQTLAAVSEQDGEKALALAATLPPGGMRAKIVADLMADLSRTDPSAAAAQALALGSPFERDLALGTLSATVATSDPDLALELLGEISFDRMQQHSGSVRFSFERGGGSTSSPAWGNPNDAVLERAVGTLARSQPERTLGLLAELPASDAINKLAESQVQQWVERAPEEASTWLATLPSGERRDSMVAGLTTVLTEGTAPDFESALAWARTMEPGGRHHSRTLSQLFSKWTDRDAAAALAAMEREVAR